MIGWNANEDDSEYLECYCVGGENGGYSVEVYANDNDKVCGVLVFDDNTQLIGAVGWIPAKAIERELINV